MNGAYRHDDTPEGRFAAVVKDLMMQFKERRDKAGQPMEPDIADIKHAIRPFLVLWDIDIRIDEQRVSHSQMVTERVRELALRKTQAEKEIPEGFRR